MLLIFGVLLAASHLYRALAPAPRSPIAGQVIAPLNEVDDGEVGDRVIDLAYRDLGPRDAPVLVMLHGSPGASECFDGLIPHLADKFRLIVPDMPGFGGSEPDIPDYSIEAHARYVVQLLEKLEFSEVHFVAYSMGGGVALHAAEMVPGRTASIVMLSSIGVQEHELLGDYTLNNALHALQLGALWLVQEGVPHFGWMDNAFLSTNYARNFYQSDQRPLRSILENYMGPMLIIHGEEDSLVPAAAAHEHARIVPQSETVFFDSGHMLVFSDPGLFAPEIAGFIRKAGTGSAVTRAAAEPVRLAAAGEQFRPVPIAKSTGALVLVMVLLALATLGSEDLTCLSAGLLVSKGVLGFIPATAGCLVGIFAGDMGLYFMGRWLGSSTIKKAPFRWFIPQEKIATGREWFEEHGAKLIFTTRFIPGTRLPTYFGAGVARIRVRKFFIYFAIAALVWTPLLVGLSAVAGGRLLKWFERYEGMAVWGLLAVALLFWVVVKFVMPAFTWKGRRLLVSRWRRVTRWEFWPLWALYPPVFLYLAWLCLRHRSLTLFTAANPGIPCGGIVLESKEEILSALAPSGAVARFGTVSDRPALDRFMTEVDTGFPVVLKPDTGERGEGVTVVHDGIAAGLVLADCPGLVIAQEYIPGPEFGVFYYRRPGEEDGHIFSITEKHLISVTGDGRRTLEQLILTDDRAVCMAQFFLKAHAENLLSVPEDGQRVPLTQLGTHSRGALFLDGADHITPELEREVDRISKVFEGFYFGRYDIRTPSVDDFRAGKNLTVLELNGVTSESTNIYDPKYGLAFAYRTLFAQWRLCFEIAAGNAAAGDRPSPLREIVSRIRQFRNKERFETPARPPTIGTDG